MRDKTRPRLFEILKTGLEEGIAHERGKKKLRVTEVSIEEPPAYSGEQVQALRQRLKLSQALLADVLAVSVRTVQAWEQAAHCQTNRDGGCSEVTSPGETSIHPPRPGPPRYVLALLPD